MVDDVALCLARLQAAAAELADLPWGEVALDDADAVVVALESVQRTLSTAGYHAIQRLKADTILGRGRRLRDHLANGLHVSATEAGKRIATAADLSGDSPALPETAAAARHGLIGAEHIDIIRDTVSKLPDTAGAAERARMDLELTGVAVAERPEVLRREAALWLADFDATHADPVTRERTRQARRSFAMGPQDADGMRTIKGRVDPEAGAYLEILLAKLARPGMCNATDPLPAVDGDPDPVAAATDTRTTGQRNHDALNAGCEKRHR